MLATELGDDLGIALLTDLPSSDRLAVNIRLALSNISRTESTSNS